MISSLSLFANAIPTPNASVKLPNGSLVPITHIGTVHISTYLVLHNSLCVPSFDFNLISATKLAHDLNSSLVFLDTHCFI